MQKFVIVTVGPLGLRCVTTDMPFIPDNHTSPGEISFLVEPIQIQALHDHPIGELYPRIDLGGN